MGRLTTVSGGVRARARPLLHAALGPALTSRLAIGLEDASIRARYRIDPRAHASAATLRDLYDAYRGRRCFIIGNGPSLKQMDLSPLRHEVTFGLNRAYLMFEKLGFETTFLVAINRYVIEQCAVEIARQPCLKFISWQNRDLMLSSKDTVLFQTSVYPRFSQDANRQGLWEGATVTYAALQLAFHMGFDEVVLLGVDHSFQTQGPAHQLVTSSGDDPNHFDASYFGKGFRWQLPDLETSEIAYRLARAHFEGAGRRIVDATVGGKLTVFPKADYADLVGMRTAAAVEAHA